MILGICPAHIGVLFCSVVLSCQYTPETTRPCSQWCLVPNTDVLSVILLIIHLWQYCVWCIRSGVIWCTHLMVLYLDCMYQCALHTVPLLHITILMCCFAAEPHSTTGFLFPSQCPSGMILLIPYSMVWDWQVSRAGPMLFYWPKLLYPYYGLLLFFPFTSFCQ